jgi:hypothetical protein
MAKIYKYRKITDAVTTYALVEPDYNLLMTDSRIKELGAVGGYTFVSVPDDLVLPDQPQQICLLEAESFQAAVIDEQVVELIRRRYSINDEFKMLRIGPSEETAAYNDYVEECRAWGRGEKAKIGS